MSLKLWFPFTKNILNYGTGFSEVSSTDVTLNANGKIGGCYSFNGSSSYLIGTHNFISNDINDWSFACWLKLNSTRAGQTLFTCRTGAISTGISIFGGSSWIIDDGVRWNFTPTTSLTTDTWYHICIVRKKGIGKYLFINGSLDRSIDTTGTMTSINTSTYSIGSSQVSETSISGNYLYGYLNDVRFYDNALSIAEIKELAKGLVRHYKLDDFSSSDNLIINGNGELGGENWLYTTSDYISTTEIPPNHPEIKASFYHSNMTRIQIPIARNHSYTISGYFKATTGSTGTVYPSIYPYDSDHNFIAYYMSAQGFDPNTLTTLSQPLHTGDTVIYATNLSNWRVDTTSYYYFAAIFGYKNSDGYVYEDLLYTRDTPQFGTRTDKSNIDKINNTITLRAPYTGADRPAGTSICQSTAGSTNYYPWGGISCSSIADWTFKTFTFTPANEPRLTAAEYFRWSNYITIGATNDYYGAGIKLTDNFLNNDIIVDSSGYGNNGIRNGNVTMSYNSGVYGPTTIANDSGRYSISTVFDGTSAYIEADPLPTETRTISIWVKWIKTPWDEPADYQMAIHDKQSGLAIGWSGNIIITYIGSTADVSGSRFIFTDTNYIENKWNHIVVVKTGEKTQDLYVNGVKATPSGSSYWGGEITKLDIGARYLSENYSAYFNGELSDFRAYVTELSDDDILALYNVGARILNTNKLMGYEMREGI